ESDVDNQRYAGQHGSAEALVVRNNTTVSPDVQDTCSHAVLVHGQIGGWRDVVISGNRATGIPLSTPLPGLIGVEGRAEGPVENVQITDNSLQQLGKANDSSSVGIAIAEYVRQCFVDRNEVHGFWNAIRTFPNSGPIDLGKANAFTGSVASNSAFAVAPRTAPDPAPARDTTTTGSGLKSGVTTAMGTSRLSSGTATVSNPKV